MIKVISGSRCNTETAKTIEREWWGEWVSQSECWVNVDLMETPKGKRFFYVDRSGIPHEEWNPGKSTSEILNADDEAIKAFSLLSIGDWDDYDYRDARGVFAYRGT
tara:strand:- start:195 stop:512 length:318 start_codon:yes stop_codon:yes gene_type:complete